MMMIAFDDAVTEGHDGGCNDDDDPHGDMPIIISVTATTNCRGGDGDDDDAHKVHIQDVHLPYSQN